MSYLAIIDREQDIAVMLVWGQLNIDLLYRMTRDMDHLRPTDVLLVYSDIDGVDLPADELRIYAEFANEALVKEGRINLRTCVVVEDPYVFGVTRQFGSVSEADEGTDELIHYYTCKSMAEASAWLTRDTDYLHNKAELLGAKRAEGIENQIV